MDGLRFPVTIHLHGTLSANAQGSFPLPIGMTLESVAAVASNDSAATLQLGAGDDADGIMAAKGGALAGTFSLAFFLIFIALVAELKPFPANGWALDIYESAHPGYSAIFSAATGAAALYAVAKLLEIGGAGWLDVATGIGIFTFVAANLLALPQTNDRRLLGYSSIAQTGLVLAVIGQQGVLGPQTTYIAGGLLLSHAVAKAGLYWLSERLYSAEAVAARQRPFFEARRVGSIAANS